METIGGRTHEMWQQDLMNLLQIISYHQKVRDVARKRERENDMPEYYREISKRADGHIDALMRIYVFMEYMIEAYDWKDASKAVQ